jgi:hypothetical protein
MKSYYDKVKEIYKNVISKLKTEMEEGMKIQLFDFEKEDWHDDDGYYELPTQFFYEKYNYADMYYLYMVYMENGQVYIRGRENEEGDTYDFRPEEINAAELTYLVDMVLPLIEDEKTDMDKTMKRCSN